MESQKTWHVKFRAYPCAVPASRSSLHSLWSEQCPTVESMLLSISGHPLKDAGRFDCAGISARVQQRHLQTLVLVEKHCQWMQAALFGTCWTKARQLWAEVFCRTTFPKWLSRYDFTLTFQLVHETLANATQVPLVFVQSLMTCSPKHFWWFFVCFIFVNFSSLRQLFIGFRLSSFEARIVLCGNVGHSKKCYFHAVSQLYLAARSLNGNFLRCAEFWLELQDQPTSIL